MFEGMDVRLFGDYYSYDDVDDTETAGVSDYNIDDTNFKLKLKDQLMSPQQPQMQPQQQR